MKYVVVPPTELDRQKIEKTWKLRLPRSSSLRCLLMRMVSTKPEDRPSTREILKHPYFSHIEVSNDASDASDQGTDEVDNTV